MAKRKKAKDEPIYISRPYLSPGEECWFDGCDKPVRAKSLCQGHYAQERRGERLRTLRDWKAGAKQISKMSKVDVAWLAGLLEGEGSFGCGEQHGYLRCWISLTSTDEDVPARAKEITGGVGSITYRKHKNERWKPYWTWVVSGERAVVIMKMVLPYMGKRRTERIEEVLEWMADAA